MLAHPADVITGSALLDLVSEDWLRRLVDAVPR
ncbi:MAG: class I SAM-dependent methyltransferase, partial [Alphaproteobacteria bacterium]